MNFPLLYATVNLVDLLVLSNIGSIFELQIFVGCNFDSLILCMGIDYVTITADFYKCYVFIIDAFFHFC